MELQMGGVEPRTVATSPVEAEDLHARYREYRHRQAARLVRLIPREAIRPLYRLATEGRGGSEADLDPLECLVRYCEGLVPLPPFDVWCQDRSRNPDAHLEDRASSPEGAPSAARPSTLEVRDLDYAGQPWRACLRTFRDGSVWRGFIAFQTDDRASEYRTASIFCEEDPARLRGRFRSFDTGALSAFLRSTLP